MRYAGEAAPQAAGRCIEGLDGHGGLIAVGADGSFAMPFNTELMYRGRAAGGSIQTSIWPDQEETSG